MRYALAGDEALRLWLALRDASAARLAEVERAARDYLGEDVEAIGRDELIERLRARRRRARRRPARRDEFEAGHIEGARSIPLDELERRLAELPADREVVAYCRGPFCAYAHEAVRRLHAAGRERPPARGGLARMAARAIEQRRHEPTPVDVDVLREEIRKTYTDVSTDHDAGLHLPDRALVGAGARLPASPSSRACPTRPSRASPASPTTGRSAASSRARSCSTSAAAPAPTC